MFLSQSIHHRMHPASICYTFPCRYPELLSSCEPNIIIQTTEAAKNIPKEMVPTVPYSLNRYLLFIKIYPIHIHTYLYIDAGVNENFDNVYSIHTFFNCGRAQFVPSIMHIGSHLVVLCVAIPFESFRVTSLADCSSLTALQVDIMTTPGGVSDEKSLTWPPFGFSQLRKSLDCIWIHCKICYN